MSSFVSSGSKSTKNSHNLNDTGSTHSTVSTATTLKGTDSEAPKQKKKWFSLSKADPQYLKKSDEYYAKQAVHNEAIASYFAMR